MGTKGIISGKVVRTCLVLASTVCYLSLFGMNAKATGSIGQGYVSHDSGLLVGMAVAKTLDSSDTQVAVERANIGNAARFIGIVSSPQDSVAVTSTNTSEIPVILSGEANAYVSDINGSIVEGDSLVISPLAGVLMRATDPSQYIVGYALDDQLTNVQSQDISTETGTQRVTTGLLRINIQAVGKVVEEDSKQKSSFLFLTGESLVGHPVSELRVAAAVVIFLFTIIIEGSIIYSVVRNGTIAVGRNPLAKGSIIHEMVGVSWLALLVFVCGIGVCVLVLWV